MGKIARFFIASRENDFRPPILSYKAFLIYGLILLLLRLLLGGLPAAGAAVESSTLMALINQERQNRNLAALFTHNALLTAAEQKSQDMVDRDYFAHVDPDGNYVWPKIVAAGYTPYRLLGENLAIDFSTSEGMVRAWLDSPSHRDNLLHPEFVDQGLVALYGDFQGRFTNLTTSLFGTLAAVAASPPPPAPAPEPEPTPTTPPPDSPPAATPPDTQPPSAPEPAPVPTPAPTPTPPPTPPTREAPISLERAPQLNVPIVEDIITQRALSGFELSRLIFTLFGLALLGILSADSVIIYRHEAELARSHSSYHFFGFFLIVLVSILIWWW